MAKTENTSKPAENKPAPSIKTAVASEPVKKNVGASSPAVASSLTSGGGSGGVKTAASTGPKVKTTASSLSSSASPSGKIERPGSLGVGPGNRRVLPGTMSDVGNDPEGWVDFHDMLSFLGQKPTLKVSDVPEPDGRLTLQPDVYDFLQSPYLRRMQADSPAWDPRYNHMDWRTPGGGIADAFNPDFVRPGMPGGLPGQPRLPENAFVDPPGTVPSGGIDTAAIPLPRHRPREADLGAMLPGQVEGGPPPGTLEADNIVPDQAALDALDKHAKMFPSGGSYGADGSYLPSSLDEMRNYIASEGAMLGTNGYYYKPDGKGGYEQVGRLPIDPQALYAMASQGAFSDPDRYAALMSAAAGPPVSSKPAETAAKPKKTGDSIWDNVVSGAGSVLEHTALGSAVKGLFPDLWYGMGESIKGINDGVTYGGGFSAPVAETLSPGVRDGNPSYPLPIDYGTDQHSTPIPPAVGPGGTPTGQPVYDAFGNVVFPQMPPYNPGVDNEWLYFRHPGMARGGIVEAYAEGGDVSALNQQDPRVVVIGDTEDVLAEVIGGKKPDKADEKVLRKFVELFGDGALKQLHDSVKAGMKMRPGKSGGRMVSGPGGPTDDAVPAMIEGNQPAALSDGEFVMSKDAVDGAGGPEAMQALHDQLAGLRKAA